MGSFHEGSSRIGRLILRIALDQKVEGSNPSSPANSISRVRWLRITRVSRVLSACFAAPACEVRRCDYWRLYVGWQSKVTSGRVPSTSYCCPP